MRTKQLLLTFCLLVGCVVAFATEPEAVNVVRTDATVSSTLLDNVQYIVFSADKQTMTILETDETEKDYALDLVRKVVFGAYISADNTPTPMEPLSPAERQGVHKVLENGQVVIIKDGVRYNVLGMRMN